MTMRHAVRKAAANDASVRRCSGIRPPQEADEAGTLATLRRYRDAMATLIERHDGRIVNTWGDAIIAEFSSVVEAVQCAVETQQEISGYNGGLPEPQRMKFRVGIHLGGVMVEGDDPPRAGPSSRFTFPATAAARDRL
jgi:class 3 adenylate cyclase